MQSLSRLTLFLCCTWALTLLYGEMVAYWIPLWTCSWPKPGSDFSSFSSSNTGSDVRIAILADPQLMDRTSLSLSPKSLALEAAQFYTDIYMRRSFHSSILPFRPNLIIFLGDHFDGGPYLSDAEWLESLSRFKHIFSLAEHGRSSDIGVYYLCGNHDIGYENLHVQHPEVINRYEKEFGARNYNFSAGMVGFIVVDAQTLDGPKNGKETSVSWQFIEAISSVDPSTPKVLLTHIPLYRTNDTPCGPYRSSSIINQRVSYGGTNQEIKYQNYLTKETSDRLLHLIKPVLVLSGHDHDQCTVIHTTDLGSVVEHTLGTVSWQQGNLYPSFMLLTASSSNATSSSNAVSTSLCFLPTQTHVYIWYLCQFVVTLVLLLIWPKKGFGFFNRFKGTIHSIVGKLTAPSKEKNDDEDCDYDMVWDSEGSMHLIKKNKSIAPVAFSDVGVTGRSNVVIRSSAKKHSTQMPEASLLVEMSDDINIDKTGKIQRPSRSKMMRLFFRVFRVFRLVTIIAAVNVPLYMMLLFKDWIER